MARYRPSCTHTTASTCDLLLTRVPECCHTVQNRIECTHILLCPRLLVATGDIRQTYVGGSSLDTLPQIPPANNPIEHVSPDCSCPGKRCPRCKQTRCYKLFSLDSYAKSKLKSRCKLCEKKRHKQWHTSHKDHDREYKSRPETRKRNRFYTVKAIYGLTYEQWHKLLTSQDFKCAICQAPLDPDDSTRTHTDHCHKTNIVRGILCKKCNSGLGFFNDDILVLERAIEYLKSVQQ